MRHKCANICKPRAQEAANPPPTAAQKGACRGQGGGLAGTRRPLPPPCARCRRRVHVPSLYPHHVPSPTPQHVPPWGRVRVPPIHPQRIPPMGRVRIPPPLPQCVPPLGRECVPPRHTVRTVAAPPMRSPCRHRPRLLRAWGSAGRGRA